MPFPPNWPTYIPKDKLAGWFEAYVEGMELNYWTATEFEGGAYDEREERWSVVLRRADGTKREMRPRHVVMATGVSGIPNLPDIPTLRNFGGKILHSSQYGDGEAWKGKEVLVIGTGNSGHDIAQDLYSSGAKVTLVQRSSTLIVNIEPSAQLPYALYDEGPPLEDCDLITASIPLPLARKSHILLTEQAKNLDTALLDGLKRMGFKLDFGEDGTGWQFKYLTRGGGYYFNVGCSDLIVDGEIGLAQFSDIAEFVAEGARMRTGDTLAADLIVLATGYKGQDYLVRKLFGDDVADRVGPIWGFGDEQELRNMFTRTKQPGLWFIAGSLAQCRIYSKYLGLQIKACEVGLLPRLRDLSDARRSDVGGTRTYGMIYMVELALLDTGRRAEWDPWYVAHQHRLLSIPGFRASQRFEAIHTAESPSWRCTRSTRRRSSPVPSIVRKGDRATRASGRQRWTTGTATCSPARTTPRMCPWTHVWWWWRRAAGRCCRITCRCNGWRRSGWIVACGGVDSR